MWTCEMPNDDEGTSRNWMALYMCIVSKKQITAGRALFNMGIMSKKDETFKCKEQTIYNKRKIFSDEENEKVLELLQTGHTFDELAVDLNTNKKALKARMFRYKKKKGMC